jgi:PHD/YefM family antitoxin component YafN of YafNO toxin-antitoxin module
MVRPEDIHPLTDFKRRTAQHVLEMRKSGRPRVLTINGRAAVVVADAGAYRELVDLVERLQTAAAVAEGRRDAEAGRKRPAGAVVADLRKRLRKRKAS